MARRTPSFSCLMLVFIGFQTFHCEGVALRGDSGVPDINETQYAFCEMRPSVSLPPEQLQIHGHVLFKQVHPQNSLRVFVDIHGFPSGDNQLRAIHVHEFGDLSSGCESTGGHYNPVSVDHPNHPGDLGNFSGALSSIKQFMRSPATLFGVHSILGRAVVIHEKEDDMGKGGNEGSLLHGNAGRRLACCIVGISTSKHWDKTVEPILEELTK